MIGLLVLTSVAGALTSIWIGGALVYASRSLGWANLLSLPPSDLALFVFGALGPVAALWLVVGFVQNGLASHRHEKVLRELAAQTRQTAGQTEGQVRTLIQMQQESRRRSLIDGMDLVLKDLNGQAAVLAERLGMVSEDEADVLWSRTVSGDVWAFAYAFLTRAVAYPEFPDLLAERLAQDDISTSALQIFRRRYDMLVMSFVHSDADKVVRAVLEDGPLSRLNDLFAKVDERATRLRVGEEAEATPPAETTEPAAAIAEAAHQDAPSRGRFVLDDATPDDASAWPDAEPEAEPEPVSTRRRERPRPDADPPAPWESKEYLERRANKQARENRREAESWRAAEPTPPPSAADADADAFAQEVAAAPTFPAAPDLSKEEDMDVSMARLQEAVRRLNDGDGAARVRDDDPDHDDGVQESATREPRRP